MQLTAETLTDVLLPVARLVAFTLGGFLVFRIRPVRDRLLKPVVWLVVNLVFPLYFVHSLPVQWDAGMEAGRIWALVFFFAYFVFLGLQFGAARLLINRSRFLKTDHPRELLVLFAMHNAGYIPLPIVVALAPVVVSLYLSFYVMAFMIVFFTVAVWIIKDSSGARTRFSLNAPTVGIVLGLVLAISGLYPQIPSWVRAPIRFSSSISLDAVMVVLGAVLASVPGKSIRFRKEFGGYIVLKMIIFPLAVFAIMAMVKLPTVPSDVAAGIKLTLVLQAAVPPATNIMVITKAYGNQAQVEYAGAAIIYSYVAALVLLPAFLILCRILFA